jgi:hypothetical protein
MVIIIKWTERKGGEIVISNNLMIAKTNKLPMRDNAILNSTVNDGFHHFSLKHGFLAMKHVLCGDNQMVQITVTS